MSLIISSVHSPFGVTILLDIIFTFTEGIPQFDAPVSCTTDDLSVVCTEADTKDIGSVTDESTGGRSGVEIPKTKGMVPRWRQGELTIGWDDDVWNEVIMTVKRPVWVTVLCVVSCQFPNNNGLVWANHQHHNRPTQSDDYLLTQSRSCPDSQRMLRWQWPILCGQSKILEIEVIPFLVEGKEERLRKHLTLHPNLGMDPQLRSIYESSFRPCV